MSIKIGDRIPPVTLKMITPEGAKDVKADELFAGRKVVLFAVPGAFTPTCSGQHLPGYLTHADELRKKGVDTIACLSVNDAFVMGAWAKDKSVGDAVVMLADGNGDFTRAVGLELDGSKYGMGRRSQRYALVADDGVVTHLGVEEPSKFEASKAETILGKL
jgi:glutaredoxin/glutathione-dependent peroxiredoxin